MKTIAFLEDLVKMDTSTVAGGNACIDYIEGYLKVHGIPSDIVIHNDKKSLVSVVGEGDKTIVLNGHIDVVSAESHQYKPKIKDDLMYGRGTSDMKGGVAAMIHAFIKCKDFKHVKVMLQVVSDEEVGGHDGTKILIEQGYVGDFVVCTEPTQMNISTHAKGILQLDIISYGKSAHGSRPWLGDNAIIKGFKNFERISQLPILHIGDEVFDKSSLNLSFSHGGDIYNRVPDHHRMGLDIRYTPHLNPDEILASIKQVVDGDVIVRQKEPGISVSSDNLYIKKIVKAIKRVRHEESVKLMGQHGSSDMRFYAGVSIPAIEFGPIGGNWHGKDEYVDLNSVYDLEAILVEFLTDFSWEV